MMGQQSDLFSFDMFEQGHIEEGQDPTAQMNIYTIASNVTFVDALAGWLLQQAQEDPLYLSDWLILLPTRRACRALRDAFLRLGEGKPVLLPVMRPIGDVDEDELLLGAEGQTDIALTGDLEIPEAISSLHRQLLLTSLIRKKPVAGQLPTVEQAARLAQELAKLLDQVQTEQLSFAHLEGLVEEAHEFSEHWKEIIGFLDIIRQFWPVILEEQAMIDPAERRNRILDLQADIWEKDPPKKKIIAAGMTGSIPAAARLLKVIARLADGMVILPGVDKSLSSSDWQEVAYDESHPQFGFAKILAEMGLTAEDVQNWPFAEKEDFQASHPKRITFMSEVLRPASTTDQWRNLTQWAPEDLSHVTRIDCPTAGLEATTIALMMRAKLQEAGKTVALVSPDRMLARRVASELQRWDIQIDDSAGQPLATTAPATFMRLVSEAAILELSPVILLSVLKHPLAACGMDVSQFRRDVRLLETECLRGPKPTPGIEGLNQLIHEYDAKFKHDHEGKPNYEGALEKHQSKLERLRNIVYVIEAALLPLIEIMRHPCPSLEEMLKAHMQATENLARTNEFSGADRLWVHDAGESLSGFLANLADYAALIPEMKSYEYAGLFEALLEGQAVRSSHGKHPRAFVFGPMEARLQHMDLLILGGLNEGVWPPEGQVDPWMSRPMRQKFGLPLPERRIGLSAHDFAQCFCAKEVVLTRAEKVDGSPTVPSRWLSRMDVVLEKIGLTESLRSTIPWLLWAQSLGQAEGQPIAQPQPCPPLDLRPYRLSVTRIESWMRNPYGIYAEFILKLKPIDPLEQEPGAADKGNFIHNALEEFMKTFPYGNELPPVALEKLLEIGEKHFARHMAYPAVRAFWWPRFERIAVWFLEQERSRRLRMMKSYSEVGGRWSFPIIGSSHNQEFILTAKADRLDIFREGSGYAIIDYKTGSPPSEKMVQAGYAPQLPLEAVIMQQGGFSAFVKEKNLEAVEMGFWKLSGGDKAGEIKNVGAKKKPLEELIQEAEEGVRKLVHKFYNERTAYLASPKLRYASRFNDYEHLAREGEWRIADGGEG